MKEKDSSLAKQENSHCLYVTIGGDRMKWDPALLGRCDGLDAKAKDVTKLQPGRLDCPNRDHLAARVSTRDLGCGVVRETADSQLEAVVMPSTEVMSMSLEYREVY